MTPRKPREVWLHEVGRCLGMCLRPTGCAYPPPVLFREVLPRKTKKRKKGKKLARK
jgi:hypothetical protein